MSTLGRPARSCASAVRTRNRGAAPSATSASAPPFTNDRRVHSDMSIYLRWNSGEPRTSAASFSTSVSSATRS